MFANWNAQNAVWLNQHRHCYAPTPPTLGNVYGVQFTSAPGYGLPTAVVPVMSLRSPVPVMQIPGFGNTIMQLNGLQLLGVGIPTAGTGAFNLQLAVPNNALLRGMPLLLQAVVVEPFGLALTNTISEVVQ